tara:strand:+ start:63 stop:536 length:474 start_codon:yes stop_codon:yes gene_type:complete
MKINKIITTLALFLLLSCDYQPIYSAKNIEKNNNFTINSIVFSGKNKINQSLKNKLVNHINNKEKKIKYDLIINSNINKKISSKNKKGNPERYITNITFDIEIFENGKFKNKKEFQESFEYKNKSSKYDLKIYEGDVSNNLVDILSENIIKYLNSLK